jgi:hypothetical protein
MKKIVFLILISFSLANADDMTRKQLSYQTNKIGNLLEKFCHTQMAQTPDELAEQYSEIRARHLPEQEQAYKDTLKFCIKKGYISKDILG